MYTNKKDTRLNGKMPLFRSLQLGRLRCEGHPWGFWRFEELGVQGGSINNMNVSTTVVGIMLKSGRMIPNDERSIRHIERLMCWTQNKFVASSYQCI